MINLIGDSYTFVSISAPSNKALMYEESLSGSPSLRCKASMSAVLSTLSKSFADTYHKGQSESHRKGENVSRSTLVTLSHAYWEGRLDHLGNASYLAPQGLLHSFLALVLKPPNKTWDGESSG